ncbi:MAG: sodium/solute symporter [Bacteroidota bacterium]
MFFDLSIVLTYFVLVMVLALRGRQMGKDVTVEDYFLSSRQLRWPSIAISTIATNVQGYQFLGMMGSAYLYGLAQANLEINAVQGILLAALVFVPLYLRERVITISQFISSRLGEKAALGYSLANIALLSTVGLGAALMWGAYAAEAVFGDYLRWMSEDRFTRASTVLIALGVFSAVYTYLGGLRAVVKTDIIQFVILAAGGLTITLVAVNELGGWSQLYTRTPAEHMSLHLPADHENLPWTLLFGLFFLNINYWCGNQAVMQRSLAAKSLREAQLGLMVGGVMKYFMAVIIIVPGIALYGLIGDELSEVDAAFPYLVQTYLPSGLAGLILCALFASLMSTVDSTFNSLSTLWSVDIYGKYIKSNATDYDLVRAGRQTILVCLLTGLATGLLLLSVKFSDGGKAFTHFLNETRYFVNCGLVVLLLSAVLLISPRIKFTLLAFVFTVPLNFGLKYGSAFLSEQYGYTELNYFLRAGIVIALSFFIFQVIIGRSRWVNLRSLFYADSKGIRWFAVGLFVSLIFLHVVFH